MKVVGRMISVQDGQEDVETEDTKVAGDENVRGKTERIGNS